MKTIIIDIESYAEISIRDCGAAAYAEHPATEILCICWHEIATDKTFLWVPGQLLTPFLSALSEADKIVAHNAEFERFMLQAFLRRFIRQDKADTQVGAEALRKVMSVKLWDCTMSRCSYFQVPAALKDAAIFLEMEQKKDEAGQRKMQALAAPKKPTKDDPTDRYHPKTHPELFKQLYLYCIQDVATTKELHLKLPPLPAFEQTVFWNHLLWNDYGVPTDTKLAEGLFALADKELEIRKQEMIDTNGFSPTQVGKLLEAIQACGVDIPNAQSATLAALADSSDWDLLTPELQDAISARADLSKAAYKKLKAICLYAHKPSRTPFRNEDTLPVMRGTLRYYKAHTGRWGGSGPQLQNLTGAPKGMKPEEVPVLAEQLSGQDLTCLDSFQVVYGSAIQMANYLVRPVIKAPAKCKLVVVDMSQIEARVAAWLAGDAQKTGVFASGKDIYTFAAAAILKKSEDQVTSDERKVYGKVTELALGYQGAAGAFLSMGKVYGVHIPEAEALEIVKKWRAANPTIVLFWKALETAFASVASGMLQRFKLPIWDKSLSLIISLRNLPTGPTLQIELPSGRCLFYPRPEVVSRQGRQGLRFSAGHHPEDTYGGKLFENLCQAVARDCLAEKMGMVESSLNHPSVYEGTPCTARVRIFMHVHDEMVCQVDDVGSNGDKNPQEILAAVSDIFSKPIPWAKGLPLASKGYVSQRYYKD